jgi:hypothetical protein
MKELVERMEKFPPGAWEFARPSILTFLGDLSKAYPSKGLTIAREKLLDLGRRFDAVNWIEPEDDEDEEESEEVAIVEEKPLRRSRRVVEVNEDEEDEEVDELEGFLVNDPPCEKCQGRKTVCLRRSDQPEGSRCVYCSQSKRGCSLLAVSKTPQKSRGKKPAPEGEVVEEEVEKTSKGKGIFSAISKSFKRKQEDRSPEAAFQESPSRYPSTYAQPSISSFSDAMGPPPTSSAPSMISFGSRASGASNNPEAAHLRLLLNASQEDLRLQVQQADEDRIALQRRYDAQLRRQQERFDAEREFYEGRIAELERLNRGEGGSGSARRG